MAKKVSKKVTTVREHPMHVPVSEKNPTGITIRDQHERRLKGTYLDSGEIEDVFKNYDKNSIVYPTKNKLTQPNSDKYDDAIAVWCDYFNKKFNTNPPLEPNVVKALFASESDFKVDPKNPSATGIAQITPETLKALQDPNGEVKEFVFKNIRKKDLKNPDVAIPMAIRWLSRKKRLAEGKLGRAVTAEEIILEYKGLLKSKSEFKEKAIKKFRKEYGKLTEK
tara:strand:+ start:193736 stop:194404 length:669 start_codon:yes stop_codon:yes gene_type:complete